MLIISKKIEFYEFMQKLSKNHSHFLTAKLSWSWFVTKTLQPAAPGLRDLSKIQSINLILIIFWGRFFRTAKTLYNDCGLTILDSDKWFRDLGTKKVQNYRFLKTWSMIFDENQKKIDFLNLAFADNEKCLFFFNFRFSFIQIYQPVKW